MCEPRPTTVSSTVMGSTAVRFAMGATVVGGLVWAAFQALGAVVMFTAPAIALALPIGLAISANRSHRAPVRTLEKTRRPKVRPAPALEPAVSRRRVATAPRLLELEAAQTTDKVLDGVVLERVNVLDGMGDLIDWGRAEVPQEVAR